MTRSRTVNWEDPLGLVAAAQGRSGLELMQELIAGHHPPPPIAQTLGFALIAVAFGEATFSLEPGEHLYNPIGVVHGGVAATLLDSAMGCAVHSTLAAGERYTTLELKVNYVGAILADTGTVTATAKIVHRGGRTATAEARAISERGGKLLAHGTTTCLIMR